METDYLVVGAGASGLAFADSLVAAADARVTLVDRRRGVGGHWRDAYPFVRLHIPSAYYGVNSLALGQDRIDVEGENAGHYERATGSEVRAYFEEVAARLEATGRVRILAGHEHVGSEPEGEVIRDLDADKLQHVAVRRRVVDARYLEASIPATHKPGFETGEGAQVIPVNELPAVARTGASYTVLGAGKTAVDACMWLLDNDVEPDRIRWVRPRDAWFHHRADFQPLTQVGSIMAGIAADAEAGAQAADLDDLMTRLEDAGRLTRLDPSTPATMYRATMLSAHELRSLRQIEDVVRLGRVRRIEADRVVLERGSVATDPHIIHVDCTARGLRDAPTQAIFQPGRIVLQQVRQNSPTFNAALIGVIESLGVDDDERNRLCPPNPFPATISDWPGMSARTWSAEQGWTGSPEVSSWVAKSRLNLLAALPEHFSEPAVQDAVRRYATHVGAAVKRLFALDRASRPEPVSHGTR